MEGHRRPREDAVARPALLRERSLARPITRSIGLSIQISTRISTLRRFIRSWQGRVAVGGHSMAPGLRAGDWLLVDPDAYRAGAPRPGDLVLAQRGDDLLVKRVGALPGNGMVELTGDAPSGDGHRHDLALPLSAISGRPWFRYWPPRRLGRVR